MKIYYDNNGVIQTIKRYGLLYPIKNISGMNIYEIDDISSNENLCNDIFLNWYCSDINGVRKYYISGGELYETENWEKYYIGDS